MANSDTSLRILVIEDDDIDRMAVHRAFRAQRSIELVDANSVAEGVEKLRADTFDCVLVDYGLPDGTAVDLLERVGGTDTRVPIIILTGFDDQATALEALSLGAQDYILKSELGGNTLFRSVHYAVQRQQVQALERSLVHADRLSAIGQLAAGVAHEINNPACYILANLGFIRESLAEIATAFESVSDAGDAALAESVAAVKKTLHECDSAIADSVQGTERICHVVSELRPFSRIERGQVDDVDINDILETALSIVSTEIRHRATLVKDLGKLPIIIGDRAKLTQAAVNLVTNAAQAIEAGAADKNTITVRSSIEANTIVVVIADTGKGIDEAEIGHIFEPFFTTKPREVGTGLGLAVTTETVRKHGGDISVQSVLGEGTRFEVRIPIDTGLVNTAQVELPAPPAATAAVNARVLLIDDDKMVRSGLRRLLSPPHDVVEADNGAQALEILAGDRFFDVIICDLMMPEVDGPAVYESLKSTSPDLIERMVFLTGGAFTPRAKEFMANVGSLVLEKPIARDRLLAAVAAISGGDSEALQRQPVATGALGFEQPS